MRRAASRWRTAAHYVVGSALLLWTATAGAQEVSREREALRHVQQQFAKLQEENNRLREENSRLQQANVDLGTNLKASLTDVTRLKGETGRLRKSTTALKAAEDENAALAAKLTATDERLKETLRVSRDQIDGLQARLTQSRDTLQTVQRESQQSAATLNESLERETARATACENKNVQLFGVTSDLINRYKENRGAWEKFLLSEPFTGLKSVEVDNLLQEFRDRATKARVDGKAPSGGGK